MPPPQPPPIFGIEAAADSKDEGIAFEESGEKVDESSLVSSVPLHSGQARPSVPAPIFCMRENVLLQELHLYSYIGMSFTSFLIGWARPTSYSAGSARPTI